MHEYDTLREAIGIRLFNENSLQPAGGEKKRLESLLQEGRMKAFRYIGNVLGLGNEVEENGNENAR
jgi:hypothetical protein